MDSMSTSEGYRLLLHPSLSGGAYSYPLWCEEAPMSQESTSSKEASLVAHFRATLTAALIGASRYAWTSSVEEESILAIESSRDPLRDRKMAIPSA